MSDSRELANLKIVTEKIVERTGTGTVAVEILESTT
jgi:hypothetical protein